jgi:hypothetical protein
VSFIAHGSSFSAAFDAHGSRSGQLPGLRQGWLFGRSVVSILIDAALPKQRTQQSAGHCSNITRPYSSQVTSNLIVCRTCQTFNGASSGRAYLWPQLQWLALLQPAER